MASLEEEVSFRQNVREDALKTVFAAKEKKLQAAIHGLQKQVEGLNSANSDAKRAQYITLLQSQAKERELVIDVLKAEMARRLSLTDEEVAAIVVRKTLGSPRMRPKTREEMSLEIFALEQKVLTSGKDVFRLETRLAAEKRKADDESAKALRFAAALEVSQGALAAERAGKVHLSQTDSAAESSLKTQLVALGDLEVKAAQLGHRYQAALAAISELHSQLSAAKRAHAVEKATLTAELHALRSECRATKLLEVEPSFH